MELSKTYSAKKLSRAKAFRVYEKLRDGLLPPICLLCGKARVEDYVCLCLSCWEQGHFITKPRCEVTGVPFSFEWPEGTKSRLAQLTPPAYDHSRAALRYDSQIARALVLQLKYGDRPEIASHTAMWLARAAEDILPEIDMIAAVPLHWRRLLSRRFNQASELARALAKISNIAFCPDILLRIRRTRVHIGLGRAQRRRNVRGAFAVHARWRDRIKGKAILLVDDVMTTGATVESCARTLRRAGVRRIDVAVLARVIHEEEMIV